MEWVALIIWLIVVGVTGLLALTGGLTSPWFFVQALLALLGFVATIVYITDGANWLAWTAAGLCLVAAALNGLGVQMLVSDQGHDFTAGQTAEELAASFAGIAIPFLMTLTFIMVLAAVGVTTVD